MEINVIVKNVGNQTVAGPQRLSVFFLLSSQNGPAIVQLLTFFTISSFVQHKKEINTGLGQHVSK